MNELNNFVGLRMMPRRLLEPARHMHHQLLTSGMTSPNDAELESRYKDIIPHKKPRKTIPVA